MSTYAPTGVGRHISTAFAAVFALGVSFAIAGNAQAEEPTIYMVEEDWDLVLFEPEPTSHSPQVTFFTSPSAQSESTYFQLQMNYAADKDFSGGGFHVAAVKGGVQGDEERSVTKRALSVNRDHVRWTNVMAVINGKLLFAVKDGKSDDWGQFGGPDYLVEMESTVPDLSEYRPQQSVDSVDIGFGGNRVASVKLTEVRVYYTDGRMVKIHGRNDN